MIKYVLMLLAMFASFDASAASDQYQACFDKAKDDDQTALCMRTETSRLLKEIQEVYQNLSKDKLVSAWNGGKGLSSGNLKDMYNSWLAYRNRYCSMFAAASVNVPGSSSYDRERCLLNLTSDHYDLVKAAMINAVSGGEESSLD